MTKSVQNRYFCTGDPILDHVVKIGYFPLYLKNASLNRFFRSEMGRESLPVDLMDTLDHSEPQT